MAHTDTDRHAHAPARPLLGDITEAAQSQANVRHNASPTTMPKQQSPEVNYFQQQYHSAVLQDVISLHAQYLQLQEQGLVAQALLLQQQLMSATSQNTSSGRRKVGTSPTQRSPPMRPQGRRGGSPVTIEQPMAHYPAHGDDEESPCDCPDCNLRRLQEVMASASVEPVQVPMYPQRPRASPQPHLAFVPELPSMQQYPPHRSLPVSPLHGYSGNTYDGSVVTQHNPYAPHSPTMGGYNPYDVPYIPARADYAHYATMANDATTSEEGSLEEGERALPTGKASAASPKPHGDKRPSGPPKPSPKAVQNRRPSPSLTDHVASPAATAPAVTVTPSKAAVRDRSPEAEVPEVASTPTRTATAASSRRSPKAANAPAPDSRLRQPRTPCPYLLRVKVSQWHTNVAVAAAENIPVGTHITFDGDRGDDFGCVVAVQEVSPDETADLPRMRVRASSADIELASQLAADAQAAVPSAQAAIDRAGLPMRLVGGVYQFNREKLTFMYDSAERVDFRQLVRDLYGLYRCRIWMEPVPQCAAAATATPAGLHTPHHHAHHGQRRSKGRSPSPPTA